MRFLPSAKGPAVGPSTPPGMTGSTGPAPAYMVAVADGSWYAFRLNGRDFYARAESDRTTGHMVLTEIPDPYICSTCGLGYHEGPHEHGERQEAGTLSTHYAGPRHDFQPRGDFQRRP